jgi:hypothetical protein
MSTDCEGWRRSFFAAEPLLHDQAEDRLSRGVFRSVEELIGSLRVQGPGLPEAQT